MRTRRRHLMWLAVLLVSALVSPLVVLDGRVAAQVPDPSVEISVVDTGDDTGRDPAVVIGSDGLPFIVYLNGVPGRGGADNVKVAHCSDPSCTSATVTRIDSDGLGHSAPAVTVGSDGLPIIVFGVLGRSSSDLRVIHCSDLACGTWTRRNLAFARFFTSPSIAVGADGLPIISYVHHVSTVERDVRVAHCVDVLCSGATFEEVAKFTPGSNPAGTALTIGGDTLPVVAFSEWPVGVLRVAHCSNATCSDSTEVVVDASGDVGQRPAIATGANGFPIISYDAVSSGEVRVVHCQNATCSEAQIATVGGGGVGGSGSGVPNGSSVAVGPGGRALVAHDDLIEASGAMDLRLSQCQDDSCTIVESVSIYSPRAWQHRGGSSVTVGDDGLPTFAFYFPTATGTSIQRGELWVAHCSEPACGISPPEGPPVVVIVRGINSEWNCDEYMNSDPRTLIDALQEKIPELVSDDQFRVFSYSGDDYVPCNGSLPQADYDAVDTCGSIDGVGGSAERFMGWYNEDFGLSAKPSQVHVVSHSMGGVVVAHALWKWATAGGLPDNLQAVVTLDSPLEGHPLAGLIDVRGKCEAESAAVSDLLPSSLVIASIRQLTADELELVTTIGNNKDFIVQAGISHVPGAWLTLRIDETCVALTSHQCVWRSDEAQSAIVTSITTVAPAGGERPEPQVPGYKCLDRYANVIGSAGAEKEKIDGLLLPDSVENLALRGGPGDDVIIGNGGKDTIYGGGGADVICGGDDKDTIYGDRVVIYSSDGSATFAESEDPGSDTILGFGNKDTLTGGAGADRLDPGLDNKRDDVAGDDGSDTCYTYGHLGFKADKLASCEKEEQGPLLAL